MNETLDDLWEWVETADPEDPALGAILQLKRQANDWQQQALKNALERDDLLEQKRILIDQNYLLRKKFYSREAKTNG